MKGSSHASMFLWGRSLHPLLRPVPVIKMHLKLSQLHPANLAKHTRWDAAACLCHPQRWRVHVWFCGWVVKACLHMSFMTAEFYGKLVEKHSHEGEITGLLLCYPACMAILLEVCLSVMHALA